MNKNKLGEAIEAISNCFTSKSEQEANKRITEALKFLNESNYKIKTPEDFNCFIGFKVNNCMEAIAKTLHAAPAIKNTHLADFIFVNYDFLEHNIEKLCILREGSGCCADKSRHIINMFLQYSIDGVVPEFDSTVEQYWIPNFGDNQMWIDLCNGLYRLYYGHTEEYFKAYRALIECDIRKFKHIKHDWYIKFKDGKEVKYTNTWDKNTENPLKMDTHKDCYIIRKSTIGECDYPAYDPKDEEFAFLYRGYVCVPKEDVEIYSVDTEIMC